MERFSSLEAHMMNLDDIKSMTEAEAQNICLDRMIFLVARDMKNHERHIYPCYPAMIATDETSGKRSVYIFLIQNIAGRYNTAYLNIPEEDIGVTCQFWNLPPVQEAMDKCPMTNSSEVQ